MFIVEEKQMSKIGLWGGSGSGKTTYLTSLALSGLLYYEDFPWDLRGNDKTSTEWLVQTTEMLSSGVFPLATGSTKKLQFTVSEKGGGRQFVLRVIDRPGGDYSSDIDIITKETAKELAECTGLILLLDFHTDNGEIPQSKDILHVRKTTENLKSLMKTTGTLPHSLVVVLGKYDDDPLFQWLLQNDFIKVKKYQGRVTPYVANPRAAISQSKNGRILINLLERSFDKSRIWYAPISSVGFANKPDGSLSRSDHSKIIKGKDSCFIKEPENMLPINVWYPFSLLLDSPKDTKGDEKAPIVDENDNFIADETDDTGITFK